MRGLMQERPLDVAALMRRVERMFAHKRVITATTTGEVVSTWRAVVDRAGRLAGELDLLDVPRRARVATFGWNSQRHVELLLTRPMPDWTDREAVAEFAAARAEIRGDDPIAARAIAARIWDRTPGTAPPIQMANQLGMVFAKLNCKPRWRERLPEIEVPTLVVHGRRDPFFPVGNGEAIAREIPEARLLVLEEAATAIPDAAAGEVAEAMLTLG